MHSKINKTGSKKESISLFIERNPSEDYRLDYYRYILDEIGLESEHVRLFEKYEIQGLSNEEVLFINYQVFSTLGLDSIVDASELFDQGYIFPFARQKDEVDITSLSALKLLQIYYPYREIYLRRTEILIFEDELRDKEKDKLRSYFFEELKFLPGTLRNQGFIVSDLKNPDNELQSLDFSACEESLKRSVEIKGFSYYVDKYLKSLGQIKDLSQAAFKWQRIGQDDLLIRLGQRFDLKNMESSKVNQGLRNYFEKPLKNVFKNQALMSLVTQVYDLSILPLLASVLSLPASAKVNFDVLNILDGQLNVANLALEDYPNHYLLIVPEKNRNQFFSLIQNFDVEAQVIGSLSKIKPEKDKQEVSLTFNGKVIFESSKNIDLSSRTKQFSLPVLNKKLSYQINKMLKKENEFNQEKIDSKAKTEDKKTLSFQESLKDKISLILDYPGARCIDYLESVFIKQGSQDRVYDISSMNFNRFQDSIKSFASALEKADILILPDADQIKDGFLDTEKILALILEDELVKQKIEYFLERQGKILAFGNGFAGLVACGLLPYGRYRNWGDRQGYVYPSIKSYEPLSYKLNLAMPVDLWNESLENELMEINKGWRDEAIAIMLDPKEQIFASLLHVDDLLANYFEEILEFIG